MEPADFLRFRSMMEGDDDPATVLADLLRRPSWHKYAACRGLGASTFYLPQHAPRADLEAARAICAGCDVQQTCADDAIARGERHGVWGGMTEGQRRKARRTAA